jgi:two-component system nitrogen regulation response regulator GlnG
VATDVRVIAATNQDLDAMAAAGRFRRDLLYRLNGFVLTLPPLRDRAGDVALLAGHFLRRAAERLGKPLTGVSAAALAVLERYPWPGNVRELQNVVGFSAIHATGDELTPESLPAALRGGVATAATTTGEGLPDVRRLVRDLIAAGSLDLYRRVLAEVDRTVLADVLAHVSGNQVHASELLGISRNTLRAKLQVMSGTPASP